MPDFVIEGTRLRANNSLWPSTSPTSCPQPARRQTLQRGRRALPRIHRRTLIDGVNRLDGLDLSSSRAFFPERDPWGGLRGNDTPNFEPILSVSGSLNLIESGVFPGGNTPL